jgi:hypothetical protein
MSHDQVQARTEAIYKDLAKLFDEKYSLEQHGAPAMCRAMASLLGNLVHQECPAAERVPTLIRAVTAVIMAGGSKIQSITVDEIEYTNEGEPDEADPKP